MRNGYMSLKMKMLKQFKTKFEIQVWDLFFQQED